MFASVWVDVSGDVLTADFVSLRQRWTVFDFGFGMGFWFGFWFGKASRSISEQASKRAVSI